MKLRNTVIDEIRKVELKDPVLIEGLPGLGMVGRIATRYLAKQLKAKPFAKLFSPHFPYYVLVNRKGGVRLLHCLFSFWKNKAGKHDLIFLVGDSQAQTIEGQYDVADSILDFAEKHGVRTVITVGGFQKEAEEKPKVVAVSTDSALLSKALKAEAVTSPSGNPIVGTAGLLLGLTRFRKMNALCLLGETRGYLPDPNAAKSVLTVLQEILEIRIDTGDIDKEIGRAKKVVERMEKIAKERETNALKTREVEERKVTYIS
ncbi:MAG: PAC2 family protein [Candidatus Bathyarchaeota archaeon]|nr:PAC2 family protein [Candidatus Bathyarchaeota archaeon]